MTERRTTQGRDPPRRHRALGGGWADLPLRAKGLVVVAIPVAALVVAALLYGKAEAQDRQAQGLVLHTIEVERQVAHLHQVTALANQRREILAALVASVRADKPPRTRLGLLDRSTQTSAGLVRQLTAMQDEQQRLLADRRADARRARALPFDAIVLSVLLGLAGGVGAMLLFTAGVTRRARQLQGNAGRLADGLPLLPSLPGGDELSHALDVTERGRANDAVRKREATLQAVIRASPDIILILDGGGRVRYLSPAMQRITGHPVDGRIGADALNPTLVHPDDRERFTQAQRRVLTGQDQEATVRLRVRHAEGHWVFLEAHSRQLGDGELLIVSRDVTGQVVLEEELRQAKRAAEQANQAKSDYLSRMSHELRTPLNAIIGFAQLLELEELTDDQHQGLRHILSGARHLLALINEVLDIAAIEAGRLSLSLEPVAAADLVAESVSLIRPLADQHSILVVAQPCDDYVLGDRQRLMQILLNLLSNAVKYNHEGGSVRVACEHAPGGRLRITVTDTGPGIETESRELLFVPFERLASDLSSVEGTGLGLPLSKRLAEAMGGTLELASTPAQGSSFWVELPRAQGPDEGEQQVVAPVQGQPEQAGSAMTVLCIEDNLSNLQLIDQVVSRRPEVKLISATRPQLGLELANEHQPDLVLLDLHLPDMPGTEVLHRLRTNPRTADVPVVILTADARPGLVTKLLSQGARDFLAKPLDVDELLGLLDAIAVERQQAALSRQS
jgi:PAS domain S-box-containing protein